ncbi:MAG TPA: hypothetical protein VF641_02570 [Methylobacterium sp.]
MIETVMVFALGFLAASLCALLALPAVNARAARLARRRIEGMFPLSVAEIAAEKDYLKAQFAVAQRRLERAVEAARSHRHADMAAIGARTLEIASLSREIEERDAALRARETEIAATREMLGGVERDLAASRAEEVVGAATLRVLEGAHRELLDDFMTLRQERNAARRQLAGATESGFGATIDHDAVPAFAGTVADAEPDRAHAALVAEREALRTRLAAAEASLAEALARQRHGVQQDAAELRARIAEVADALVRRDRLPPVGAFPAPDRR